MARVVALIPDLLFGSNVQGLLSVAGHQVTLLSDPARAVAGAVEADVLVVDLAGGQIDGVALMSRLRHTAAAQRTRTLAFYSHVDSETRARAEQAGYDLVVPRSRMAREGAALVSRLAADGGAAGGKDGCGPVSRG